MFMICTKCNKDYDNEDFSFRNKKLNIRNKRCKFCQKVAIKSHYEKNKSAYVLRAKNKNKEIYKKLQLFLIEVKNTPCADCGKIFHHCAMDFDHIKGDKIGNVSSLKSCHSFSKIKTEITKCEVVCAVCHRIRTYNRLNNAAIG